MANPPRIVIEAVECHCHGGLAGTDADGLCTGCHGRGWVWPAWAMCWWSDYYGSMGMMESIDSLHAAQPKEANDAR